MGKSKRQKDRNKPKNIAKRAQKLGLPLHVYDPPSLPISRHRSMIEKLPKAIASHAWLISHFPIQEQRCWVLTQFLDVLQMEGSARKGHFRFRERDGVLGAVYDAINFYRHAVSNRAQSRKVPSVLELHEADLAEALRLAMSTDSVEALGFIQVCLEHLVYKPFHQKQLEWQVLGQKPEIRATMQARPVTAEQKKLLKKLRHDGPAPQNRLEASDLLSTLLSDETFRPDADILDVELSEVLGNEGFTLPSGWHDIENPFPTSAQPLIDIGTEFDGFPVCGDRGQLLQCPRCGWNFTHLEACEVNRLGSCIRIDMDGIQEFDQVSESRGSSVSVFAWCESGHRFVIHLQFHKGNVFVSHMIGNDCVSNDDGYASPGELPRD